MEVAFHKSFSKKYRTLQEREQKRVDVRLALFRREPFSSTLHNHELHGEYVGYRSINIAGDLRAIYEPVADDFAYFIFLGTHSELYE